MKKRFALLLGTAMIGGMLLSTACGEKNYADGTYSERSSEYVSDDGTTDGNGYGVVTLTIQNNQITECEFKTYELNGTLKDAEYGKENGEIANKDFYNKAQKAVGACDEYAKALVQKGNIKAVDAISGATVNYSEFQEAVKLALKQAEQ